jgi:choline dehydrogenase
VLINERNETYGVEYVRHGENKIAYATKEVILSAGAIGSPKILMQSGIGPREDLENVGVSYSNK